MSTNNIPNEPGNRPAREYDRHIARLNDGEPVNIAEPEDAEFIADLVHGLRELVTAAQTASAAVAEFGEAAKPYAEDDDFVAGAVEAFERFRGEESMSKQSDLTASAALANEMAAALEGTFPRARISMLEPPEQVARGVFAIMQERERLAHALAKETSFFSYLDREELRIKVLAECLATWQAESLDAKIDAWCNENPRRLVDFESDYCTLTDEHGMRHSAQGKPSQAFDFALADCMEDQ